MASTYTSNSGVEKPGIGDQSGEWGTTVNTNMDILDRAINGVGVITLSGTTHTLTTTDGALSDGQYKVLVLSGSPSGTNTITISPNDQDKLYFVVNNSGQTATFSQGSGANVSVVNGDTKIIYADGAGSGAAVTEFASEADALEGITAGTVSASKAVIVDANKDITGFRNVTLTGELDAGSLDISGDADIDGTLEADAMTLNGTAITTTATLSTGISNGNLPVFTTGVLDDDFLRVAGTSIEGRSAAEVLSDIGGQASLTFGISNTNAVKIDSASVADDEYARFTASGLESRSTAEVLSDIGASPVAGSSSIVTTGALDAGSITSGFGEIDNGSSAITTTGVITGGTVEATTDTAAGDNAAIGYTAAEGLILTGQGSTSDVTIKNDADATVLSIPTGTTQVGINTTAPSAQFQVHSPALGTTAGDTQDILQLHSPDTSNTTIYKFLNYRHSNGSSHSESELRWQRKVDVTNQGYIGLRNEAITFGYGDNTERMRMESSGNVGIGTTSPSKPLQVKQTAAGSGLSQTDIRATRDEYGADFSGYIDQGVGHGAIISSVDNGTATERVRITNAGKVGIGISAPTGQFAVSDGTRIAEINPHSSGTFIGNRSDHDVLFQVNAAEKMRITTAGRVGIGTSSPEAQLHVKNGGGNSISILGQYGTGTKAQIAAYSNQVDISAYNGTNDIMTFTTGGTERMRIDSSGKLLVGTTTSRGRISSTHMSGFAPPGTAGTWATSAAISVDGAYGGGVSWIDGSGGYCAWVDDGGNDFNIAGGGTGATAGGGVYINNYAGSWSSRSDERDKINLEPITDAATKIQSLRAVIGEYSWAEGVRHPFLIAQDVQKVLPEAVSIANKSAPEEEQRLGMSYTDMVPLLTSALQEALKKIESLEARITALEAG